MKREPPETCSAINNGINEATSALEQDGYIMGLTASNCNVTCLAIPVKLAVGQQQVDMGSTRGDSNILDLMNITSTNFTSAATPNATSFIYNDISSNVLSQNAKHM